VYKLTGALCIIGGCGWAGLKVAGVYRRRAELLRCLQNGLSFLEAEISYGSTPLPLALRRVGEKLDKDSGALFTRAAQILCLNKGATASEAWEEGIKLLNGNIPLTAEELSILTMFGHGLGNSAREEQLKNIALVRQQLGMAEKKAAEARVKSEKMWQYLGFCLGGVIVLVFI